MNANIIFIKLKSGCKAVQHFEDSYKDVKSEKDHFYNIGKDNENAENKVLPFVSKECYIVALEYEKKISSKKDDNAYDIKKCYLGIGKPIKNQKGVSIKLDIKVKLAGTKVAVKNIICMSKLDFSSDFEGDYITTENSGYISKQLDYLIFEPAKATERKVVTYSFYANEVNLHSLAQKNEYCQRQYNHRTSMSHRSEFQRDYERIVHSRAFRRMVDKAQIFSSTKGDHYRTRMTHSQAVAQIARGISEGLNLNQQLTEAIALGHDIGHTPFGHQGERTLDDILRNKIEVIKNADLFTDAFGGFKHNYQSVRVASILEEEYAEIDGMDLSYQTLEGMLKHTKTDDEKYKLDQFMYCSDCGKSGCSLYPDIPFPVTLEGQVVAIADEIAQRGHDLDDALSSCTLSYSEFEDFLKLKKFKSLYGIVAAINKQINVAEDSHRRIIDKEQLKNSRVVSSVISYFINDVINTSDKKMKAYDITKFEKDGHIVCEKLITFSEEALTLCEYLNSIITNKVINSSEVSLFDSNASNIVLGLFKAYYDNPKLLHKGTQRKMFVDMRYFTANVIDFESADHILVKEEIEKISKADLILLKGVPDEYDEYYKKRKVLVRNICDFIAGMTDSYAIKEYKKIVANR